MRLLDVIESIKEPVFNDYKSYPLPNDYWVKVDVYKSGKDFYFCLINKYNVHEIKSYKSFKNGIIKISKFLCTN